MSNGQNDGWEKHSLLVLNELKRLADGQELLRKDLDAKLDSLKDDVSKLQQTRSEVFSLKNWFDRVNEIWSPSQMAEAQKEIYKQKQAWARVLGILVAVEVLIGGFVLFKEYIFKL